MTRVTDVQNAITLCAVETWGTAASKSVPHQRVDGTLLNGLIASQTGEVVAGEVEDRFAVREFGLGTGGTSNDRNSSEVRLLPGVQLCSQRLWCPFVHEVVDFLRTART